MTTYRIEWNQSELKRKTESKQHMASRFFFLAVVNREHSLISAKMTLIMEI